MKDFWDKTGKIYDPFDVFDFDGDGEHDFAETMTAVDYFDEDDGAGADEYADEDADEYDGGGDEYAEDAGGESAAPAGGAGERDGRDPEQERQRLLRYFGAAPCKTEAIRQRKLFAVEHYFDLIESGEADKGAQERKELCRFVLQSSCVAADYLEAFVGFHGMIEEAIFDSGLLPENFVENYGNKQNMHGLLFDCFDMDPALFFKVWLWLMQEFAPYRKYDPDTIDTVSGFVFDVRISDMEDEACSAYFEMILSYFAKHDELLVRVIGELERLDYCIPFLFYHAITHGYRKVFARMIELILPQKKMPAKEKTCALRILTDFCCDEGDTDAIRYLLEFIPACKASENFLLHRESPKWEADLLEALQEQEEEEDL